MMKLAFCLFNYFPYGGLQRDFLRIARICQSRGHEIHVFTMHWEGKQEPGFHVHAIETRGLQNHSRGHFFVQEVQKTVKKQVFQLVIGFNKMPHLDIYYAADICYQARIRKEKSLFYRLLPRYRRWVSMESAVFDRGNKTHILLISPQQQAEFIQYYQTETNRFHLLPPGISRDYIATRNAEAIRNQVRSAYGIHANDKILLLIGSSFKTKGLDRAINALAALSTHQHHNTHLFVVGQDEAKPYATMAKRQNVLNRVYFLGAQANVIPFLLAADLLVHPAYRENTGTVLLEALASGLPILTLDHCGYAHHVQQAKGGKVLAAPFSQAVFNQTLNDMLSHDRLSIYRNNGICYAKEQDIYSLPEKAADVIESIGNHQ